MIVRSNASDAKDLYLVFELLALFEKTVILVGNQPMKWVLRGEQFSYKMQL